MATSKSAGNQTDAPQKILGKTSAEWGSFGKTTGVVVGGIGLPVVIGIMTASPIAGIIAFGIEAAGGITFVVSKEKREDRAKDRAREARRKEIEAEEGMSAGGGGLTL